MNEISKTLYAKYISQREGLEIIESPYAFIIYKISNGVAMIFETYVDEGHRKSGRFKEVFRVLYKKAKKKECDFILGQIRTNDPDHDNTLSMALHIGFKTFSAQNETMNMRFKIGEDSWVES